MRRRRAGIEGTGNVLVVEHTGDNTLVTFRFKNKDVKMLAAEDDFELAGHKFRAGAIIVPNADRTRLEPMLKDSRAVRVGGVGGAGREDARSRRSAHRLRPQLDAHAGRGLVARGARHLRRAPYTYFADQKLRDGQPAIEVRRDHLSARGRQRGVAVQRHAEDRQTRRSRTRKPRSSRTSASSTRATTSAAAWASRGSAS